VVDVLSRYARLRAPLGCSLGPRQGIRRGVAQDAPGDSEED
jgi:hypothetical protein